MKASLQDSLNPAFPDTHPAAQGPHEMALDAARGGTFSVHLLMSGLKPGVALTLDCHEKNLPVHGSHWFRLRINLPVDARAGQRQILVRILHGEEEITLMLLATVHPARIPASGAHSCPYTNWFSLKQMATRHRLKPWSPGHFEMIGRYAR